MVIKYEVDEVIERKEITIETPIYYANLDHDHSEFYGKITDDRILQFSKHFYYDDVEYTLRTMKHTDLSSYDEYIRKDVYKSNEKEFLSKIEELKEFINTI